MGVWATVGLLEYLSTLTLLTKNKRVVSVRNGKIRTARTAAMDGDQAQRLRTLSPRAKREALQQSVRRTQAAAGRLSEARHVLSRGMYSQFEGSLFRIVCVFYLLTIYHHSTTRVSFATPLSSDGHAEPRARSIISSP